MQETVEITVEDREALRRAVKSLEHPSLAARLTNLVGKPVELIGYALPSFASRAIASATSKWLEAALKVALRTLPSSPRSNSQFLQLATASGAAGGTFGLAALPVELPVSTVIMLRSIADIARSEGEDLVRSGGCPLLRRGLRIRRASRIGGRIGGRLLRRSRRTRQDSDRGRPVRRRARRPQGRGTHLSEIRHPGGCLLRIGGHAEVAAQALPLVGAIGGAAVNYAFIEHFQDVARGHFAVRRLERIWQGEDPLRI